jgi:putative metalloenzyme radical SAM/SPASM domain maturase
VIDLQIDPYPEKIYVEITTRCNLHCRMCVKYATGSTILDEDLPIAVFKNLTTVLPQAKTLILNGIGEPLLHPEILEFVRLARETMSPVATIGFQTNGFLVNEQNSPQLIAAGINTVCLSLDNLEAGSTQNGEHSVVAVSRAVKHLAAARHRLVSNLRIGLEMVLTRENIRDFPRFVTWGVENGIDFLIATHLLNYDKATEKSGLFNPNPSEAIQLINRYRAKAVALGVDLANYLTAYLSFKKTEADKKVLQLFHSLLQDAKARDIYLHIESLLEHAKFDAKVAEESLSEGREIAKQFGIELFLPENKVLSERACPFLTDKAVFIAASGAVMPCHFLWHTYSCRMFGEDVQVPARSFGNLLRTPVESIWHSSEYRQFRQEAARYEYARCWTCSSGPCADLLKDQGFFGNDCYGSQVPCGHCQWNLGGIRCL